MDIEFDGDGVTDIVLTDFVIGLDHFGGAFGGGDGLFGRDVF